MVCAKVPLESWASQCVKKAPHGAELCNRKKKKKRARESSPPGSPAGQLEVTRGQATCQRCCWVWVCFLLRLCFLLQVLKALGLWPPEGPDTVLSSKAVWPAVRFEGDLSLTHADTPKHMLPRWPHPHQKTWGFPDPLPTPSPPLCHIRREERCPEIGKALQALGAWQGGEAVLPAPHPRVGVRGLILRCALGVIRVCVCVCARWLRRGLRLGEALLGFRAR